MEEFNRQIPAETLGWVSRIAGHPGPLYRAIADCLGTAIASGEIPPGTRLPTHRALADALRVDLTTVTRAYAEARRRGLIEATVGRGSFARGTAPTAAGLIDLSMNLPPQPAEPSLARLLPATLARLLASADRPSLLTYRASASPDEQQAGQRWLRPTLGDIEPARILIAPGAQPALLAVLGLVARAGDVVLTDMLTFPGLRAAAAQLGIALAGVAADADGMRPDALEAACREHRPKALYCIPTIHNPTTATLPAARRRDLVAVARAQALPIIEDDAYGLLPGTPQPALAALAPELIFHISTVSKLLSPALRVAFVIAPDGAQTSALSAALRANIFMPSPLFSGLVADWIRDGTAAAILAAIRDECAARQRLARQILPAGTFDAHPEGIHLWLRLPARRRRADFVAHLRDRGLALVPSDAFAVGATVPEAVRLSLGAAPSRDRLEAALRAIAGALADPGVADFSEIV